MPHAAPQLPCIRLPLATAYTTETARALPLLPRWQLHLAGTFGGGAGGCGLGGGRGALAQSSTPMNHHFPATRHTLSTSRPWPWHHHYHTHICGCSCPCQQQQTAPPEALPQAGSCRRRPLVPPAGRPRRRQRHIHGWMTQAAVRAGGLPRARQAARLSPSAAAHHLLIISHWPSRASSSANQQPLISRWSSAHQPLTKPQPRTIALTHCWRG